MPCEARRYSRDQIGLELVQINVEGAIETKRCGDSRDNLSDDAVQIGEAGLRNTEVLLADVVNSFVIDLVNACSVKMRLIIGLFLDSP